MDCAGCAMHKGTNGREWCVDWQQTESIPLLSEIATCERSFSQLKFVINYMRSTVSEVRLIDQVMLSREKERTKKLDPSKVVILLHANERFRILVCNRIFLFEIEGAHHRSTAHFTAGTDCEIDCLHYTSYKFCPKNKPT